MKIEDILSRASDTKALSIGDGVIVEAPECSRDFSPGKGLLLLLMPQRGELRRESSESFESDGLSPEMPLYSPIPTFMPNGVSSNSLTTGCSPRMQWLLLLVSARSMIFAKLSSCHAGRRYMTVGTAASMDGYTAYGASIIKDGKKQSFSCPAPLGFIADIDIISNAPWRITASGYATFCAKVTAGADWILADAAGVEPIDTVAFNTVQNGLKSALLGPGGSAQRRPQSFISSDGRSSARRSCNADKQVQSPYKRRGTPVLTPLEYGTPHIG